ncbi:serine hydrolase domain-containing protein [Asanoa sp. NPDC050611]|uniref:serine hydrolase domain-containing protein n=1 Tax=Asanoa sp. NPDC050611 TaxID=3157098 RepID=UPI0033EDFC18
MQMWKHALVAAVLAGSVLVASPAHADATPDLAALADDMIARQLSEYGIPGAAVVVVQNGKQIFGKGYGVADTTTKAPVSVDDTGFFMASVAKLFTAEAVRQQVALGRLDLHVDVNRYLTGFQIKDTYPGHAVTLDDLLTHSSGFADTALGVAVDDPRRVEPLGTWLAAHQPPRVRPPGTLVSYDNYGMALAGYLVEVASGQPFADYVQQQILNPLGMTGTSFAQPRPPSATGKLATGYRSDGVAARGQYGAESPTGAGPTTTPADMGRFMVAQLRPGNPNIEPRFTPEPRLPGMGYAYEEQEQAGHRWVSKDGDVPGFHDNLALLPDDGLGIYVVYNGDGRDGSASFAGRELVDRMVDLTYPVSAPTAGAAQDLSAFEGSYRTTRYSRTDFTKFATLTTAVTVSADGDGLTTTGLSPDPANATQHWTPVATGVFTDGRERIAFRDGVLFSTISPSAAYERLPWYESPTLQMALAGVALLVLLLGLLWWPIAALVRRRRRPALARAATVVGWVSAGLVLVFAGLLALFVSDSAAVDQHVFLDDSGLVKTALILLTVAAGLAVAMLAGTVLAWVRGWWGRAGRLGYTAATAAVLVVVGVGASYNLIG